LHVSLDWLISHSHTAQMQSKITESLSRTTGRGTSGQPGAFLYLFIYLFCWEVGYLGCTADIDHQKIK
jgi:hypothetical protein